MKKAWKIAAAALALPVAVGLAHLLYALCLTMGSRSFQQMGVWIDTDEAAYQAARQSWQNWHKVGDVLMRVASSPWFWLAVAAGLLAVFCRLGAKKTLVPAAIGLALCWAATLPFALLLGNRPGYLGSGDYLMMVRFTTFGAVLSLALSGALAAVWKRMHRKS